MLNLSHGVCIARKSKEILLKTSSFLPLPLNDNKLAQKRSITHALNVISKYSPPITNRSVSSKNGPVDVASYYDRFVFPQPPDLISEDEHNFISEQVNHCITSTRRGRLFVIVQVAGKQFKVTDHDLIRTNGYINADVSDQIRLEKVLLVGGRDFTLVGTPMLRRSLVKVEATIIEKTPGAEKIIQYFLPRKSFERKYIYTPSHTVLRINSIQVYPELS